MTRLHVNIDHIATLRQARGVQYPDPVFGVSVVEMAGAQGITVHLREDRRHIVDRDVALMRQTIGTVMNLEMAAVDEIVKIAVNTKPDMCTLVPEKREERTTEGGLAVAADLPRMTKVVQTLHDAGIRVSLFIDPDEREVRASKAVGADMIELHTGDYCEAESENARQMELEKLKAASTLAASLGLRVAAGHGLHYHNVRDIADIPEVEELNIGHSIIARAVFVGLEKAVTQMLAAMGER
ncbi:MAG: pyridoxine 5'-phosphate synthase [Deltaproteobacteria bacterium]|nr:pyridoxine 5'-phosphate synthase [Deltaproteobacteria bacterium]